MLNIIIGLIVLAVFVAPPLVIGYLFGEDAAFTAILVFPLGVIGLVVIIILAHEIGDLIREEWKWR